MRFFKKICIGATRHFYRKTKGSRIVLPASRENDLGGSTRVSWCRASLRFQIAPLRQLPLIQLLPNVNLSSGANALSHVRGLPSNCSRLK